ncbi:MAG: SUMF1/EgtB/PvdO family nonheme iron enzyme [Verrucomicrobia bacterium]|jgi:formylglycine-generating enzyme required for sulfatase activity/tRNA A-37 threonylcarbamoyl transferase component Bud32|nr:SUMF1/EgtB/PvdO family nonheme iron enzyme [Verrucomicrobiota bacterium]
MSLDDDATRLPDEDDELEKQPVLKEGDSVAEYRVVRLLGRGGMGEVYEVEHKELHTRFALKLIHPSIVSRGDTEHRFRREAQVMAKLKHPNIVHVDDFRQAEGRAWLRMELVEGVSPEGLEEGTRVGSLGEWMKRRGKAFSEEATVEILRQVLEGLAYAHAMGVVHRDMKPANLLLTKGPSNRKSFLLKIADFGLVRLAGADWLQSQVEQTVARSLMESGEETVVEGDSDTEGTSTRALLGTFAYMSPEQKRGEEADKRSDLYAVGLIAYQLLTGEESLGMRRPSELVKGLHPAWDQWILKATESQAGERFADAREMLAAVPGIGKVPEGRATAPVKRKAPAVLWPLLLLGVLGLAAGGGYYLWQQGHFSPQPEPVVPDPEQAGEEVPGKEAPLVQAGKEPPEEIEPLPEQLELLEEKVAKPPVTNIEKEEPSVQPKEKEAPLGAAAKKQVEETPTEPEQRPDRTVEIPGAGKDMSIVWIPAGSFRMGSPTGERGRKADESPVTPVTFSNGFWMGTLEVTREQWTSIMGGDGSRFGQGGEDLPATAIGWNEARSFCEELTRREAEAGRLPEGYVFRLPTEAEWEYACRAGTRTAYSAGDREADLYQVGWYNENAGGKPHPVGRKAPNAWGLHDMHGNVREWCLDWYGPYSGSEVKDPTGATRGTDRVNRGGSFQDFARECRSANRSRGMPGFKTPSNGFRIALAAEIATPEPEGLPWKK